MDEKRLNYLFEQDRQNRLSAQDRGQLDAWYEALYDPDFVPKYMEGTPEAEAYVAEQTAQIMRRINRHKPTRAISFWTKIAALVVMGMVSAYLVWPKPNTGINKRGIQR